MSDDDLISELRRLLARIDPVGPRLLEQARATYTWRTVDAELAELSFDSLVDRDMLAGVRDDGAAVLGPRMLGFGAVVDGEAVAIEVEIEAAAGRSVLVGQLHPPRAADLELQASAGDVVAVAADELGRFRVEPVPPGPLRLRVYLDDRVVETTWVSYVRD